MHLNRKTEPNNQIGEKEYRALKSRLNYSGLKTYSQSRYKFYKEYVLGDIVEKDETHSTTLGGLVHCILADDGTFHERYTLAQCIPPTGQILTLVEELYKRSLRSIDDQGRQKDEFSVMFKDAFAAVKYEYDGVTEKAFKKKTMEWALEKFQVEGEMYYKELLENTGKTVVSVDMITKAEKLVEMLRTHQYTADIVNDVSDGDIEVFNELVILYTYLGIEYRSMIDKTKIDHSNKTIQPYDYKCSYDVENGFEYSYLKYGYYLQVGVYDIALNAWKIEHDMSDYTVLPMIYIAVDTTGNTAPVKYQITDKDLLLAMRGFTIRGKKYEGVESIHKNIMWNISTGIWNTSEEVYKNNGLIQMKQIYR